MSKTNAKDIGYNRLGFWALIVTQFQGAFNDNLYRFAIIFFMVARYAPDQKGPAAQALTMKLSSLGAILFAIPFLVFPGLAGSLSDRFSKRTIVIMTKVWEVFVMLAGWVAFLIGDPYLIFIMLLMMFTQSAFFSPAKYGILPEFLPEQQLSWANGLLGMTTFVAIIAGQSTAGFLSDYLKGTAAEHHIVSGTLVVLSLVGLISAHGVPRVLPANPTRKITWNPWSGLTQYFKTYYSGTILWLVFLGATFFWFAGAIVQVNVIAHGLDALKVSDFQTSLLSVAILVGIGTGSLVAGWASGGKIELGLVPIGIAGMMISSLLLALPGFSYPTTACLLFSIGFFGGFFDVPLMAYLQYAVPNHIRGGMMATLNIGTSLGILLGGGVCMVAGYLHLTTYHIFLFVGLLALSTCLYLSLRFPIFVLRSFLWLLVNTLYRVRVTGREHVPLQGGALLVANHTSFVDALFILASIDRHVRFLTSTEIYSIWWIRPIAKLARAIPVSPMDSPRQLLKALHTASEALRNGELVCVFAEGQISRTGQMLPFKKGFERIMKDIDVPIVPVHLDRLWGSVFSFSDGRFFWKLPKRIPYPVAVSYGKPLPSNASSFEVKAVIRELGTKAFMQRRLYEPILHRSFLKTTRRHPSWKAVADATMPGLSYFSTLVATIMFSLKLKKILQNRSDKPWPGDTVGVLLPPTVGAALTNIALQLMGKVPVNLNYTASADGMASAAKKSGIEQVITAKAFLERLPLQVPGEAIYLEDVKNSITKSDKIKAVVLAGLFLARLCPIRVLERLAGSRKRRTQEDVATIIFSSGSESEPKGVPLTHFNISSNIEAALQVFPHEPNESVIGFLPFFHSFGFTGTLWLPLSRGFSAVYHPTPLEAKAIAELIYRHKCTFLIAAPTFLLNFIRRCLPEELSSVKYCITGAEKLPARIREAFREKFGLEPLEGYGTTECSPIVSVNIPDFRAPGFYQVGTKHGTIGMPLPGISVRIVDPDTGAILPPDTPGLLEVKGPNIMKGYLNMPEKTAEVLHDGWYNTGDIASIDEDGFIRITDRLARFSKIAGEMVPHTAVEEKLHALLGLTDLSLAVVGLPDSAKGERLVVLHTLNDEQIDLLLKRLDSSGLPNLWIPKASSFYRVEQIPVLGTGKLDIRAVKELAKKVDVGSG